MLSAATQLLSFSSLEEIVDNMNLEIHSVERSMFRIFVLSVSFVHKYRSYNTTASTSDNTVLAGCVSSLSMFLLSCNGDVDVNLVSRLVSKEITSVSVDVYRLDLKELAERHTERGELENSVNYSLIVERVQSITPDYLLPLLQMYIDYGIVADWRLNVRDKTKLYHLLGLLGMEPTAIQTDFLQDLIPRTNTERLVFLSLLAEEHPMMFTMFTSAACLSKFVTMVEVLQGVPGMPTLDELVILLEKTSRAAQLNSTIRSVRDRELLMSMVAKTRWDTPTVGMCLFSALSDVMLRENDQYLGKLDKVSAVNNGTVPIFHEVRRESDARMKFYKELNSD